MLDFKVRAFLLFPIINRKYMGPGGGVVVKVLRY